MMESTSTPAWRATGAPERGVRSRVVWLGLGLLLAAGPTLAQVPQEVTFSGRLVDGAGAPLPSPVEIILNIYDMPTGGTSLYTDDFFVVPLDAQGNFSVQLGTARSAGGTFGADLFLGGDRYVEVFLASPYNEILTPRVPLSSVPHALVAQQANAIVPDPGAPRFEDCGDGTVADHQTGPPVGEEDRDGGHRGLLRHRDLLQPPRREQPLPVVTRLTVRSP